MKFLVSLLTICLASTALAISSDQAWKDSLKKHALSSSSQAYCTDLSGKLEGANIDRPMNPASVTKIFVSWWALKELGAEYQFETKAFYNKEENSLHIEGGHDPFFVSENIIYLLNQLNDEEIFQLDRITFDENFLFNWSISNETIGRELQNHFNTGLWNQAINDVFNQLTTAVETLELPLVLRRPKMKVSEITFSDQPTTSYTHVFTLYSQPLYRQLKQMNQYSNNFMAQAYFDYLGKSSAMERFLKEQAGIDKSAAYFYNGSGLDNNYTTCRATLTVLKKLYQEIELQNFAPQDVLAVPSVDLGTLNHRFSEAQYKNAILAKTGTLSVASTLAGSLYKGQVHKFFAIFNSKTTPQKGRVFQDEFIKKIFTPDSSFSYTLTPYFPFAI